MDDLGVVVEVFSELSHLKDLHPLLQPDSTEAVSVQAGVMPTESMHQRQIARLVRRLHVLELGHGYILPALQILLLLPPLVAVGGVQISCGEAPGLLAEGLTLLVETPGSV